MFLVIIRHVFGFLQEMDWNTPLRQSKRLDHWRVFLVAFICTLPAFAVWWSLYPNTAWFFNLFGAFATGGVLGMCLGYIWQLNNPSRRAHSSGRLLAWSVFCGWTILLPVGVFYLGPTLHIEEIELTKIRTLKDTDVIAISVDVPGEPQAKVMDREKIISFVKKCRQSNLFYPGHESLTNKSQIGIHLSNGSVLTYEMGIPKRHVTDLVVTSRNHGQYSSRILIPGAAKWFESLGTN